MDGRYNRDPVDPLDFTFLKDRYDFELQRKEQLTTALALPVGVLGGLGGLLALMIRSFAFRNDPTTWIFAVTVTPAICSFFACMLQLARAYHRQTYKYLPMLKSLEEKRTEWRESRTEPTPQRPAPQNSNPPPPPSQFPPNREIREGDVPSRRT